MKASKFSAFLVGITFGSLLVGLQKVGENYAIEEALSGFVLATVFLLFFIAAHIWVVGTSSTDLRSVGLYIRSQFHDRRGTFIRGSFLFLGILLGLISINIVLAVVNT